ncbi:flagella basal body P-ring formation protein FlgA [Inmirania thermothiophila]|uniref:Flagella basal body P-ring formation protein FlgA n=2 Tax=Inmirania thermothiophila TaxID=1750597 RepID=A0A3N1Y805_9GAMM|nr:flagella basal body P-ring formation protein FlgA [Inmirania thermothiophila]
MTQRSLVACLALLLAAAPASGRAALQPLDAVRRAAEAHARAAAGAAAEHIEVRAGALDPRLRLPRCAGALETFDPPGSRAVGRRVVGVRCPGPRPWSLYVSVTVRGLVPVVVAARPVPRGRTLSAQDLRVERRDLAALPAGYLDALERAVGQETLRPLRPGEVVSPAALRPPRLVRRGERVVLEAGAGPVRVRSSGRALGDAPLGARVRVRNEGSGRVVEGVVVGPGRVQVIM